MIYDLRGSVNSCKEWREKFDKEVLPLLTLKLKEKLWASTEKYGKELSLCHKLWFSNHYIFGTKCCRP